MSVRPNESPRIAKLRQMVLDAKRSVDPERGRYFYEYLYQEGGLKKEPLIVANAKAFQNYLRKRTIYIDPGQLIVGSLGRKTKAIPFYPEGTGKDMMKEYAKLPTRELDRFEYTEDVKNELEAIVDSMQIKSIRSRVYGSLNEEELNIFLKNPENDIISASYLFSLDTLLTGPGGHISPGYDKVVEKGLIDARRRAEYRKIQAEAEGDQDALDFLNACIISIDAICEFSDRYAALAKEMAETETDATRKAELLRIADVCSHVPRYPCRDFWDSVQASWFLFMSVVLEANQRCYAVGRFDQWTYPFYQKDIAEGKLTAEQAQDLVDCFFMRFTETNHVQSENFTETITNFPAQQQIVVGGQTKDGKDGCNPVTYLCLQACANTRFQQPSLSVRLWEGSPPELYEATAELISIGTGHPSLFNDRVVIDGLLDKGYYIDDCRGYSINGCTGAAPTGNDKGTHNGGYFNIAAVMELVMNDGRWIYGDRQVGPHTGDPKNFKSFDDVKKAYEGQMEYLIKLYCSAVVKAEKVLGTYAPTPLVSAMVDDCITRARDRGAGGAWYNCAPTARAVGFADLVDSMAAIKKHVFDQKDMTMDELVDALHADFKGYEALQKRLQKETPHYGNDIDEVDEIATYLTQIYTREFAKYHSLYGGRFHPGFGSVSANLPYGAVVAALPSGREAWKPFADGISPCHHMDCEGPTAVVLSASKLDHTGMSGGSILNMKFSAASVRNPEGIHKLAEFLMGAYEAGFFHMQFNVVDEKVLRDAQVEPEKYPDLLVRVAGYSAFFTQLSRRLQDDIIDRSTHAV